MFGAYLRLEVAQHTVIDKPLRSDAAQYTAYAYNLERHGIYSKDPYTINTDERAPAADSVRYPGYPVFLYFLVEPGDLRKFMARVVSIQTILGIFTLLLVYFIARTLLPASHIWPAILLAAVSPHLININTYVLSETVFTLALLLTTYTYIKGLTSNSNKILYMATALLIMTTLIRPTTQFFIIFLIIILLFVKKQEKKDTRIPAHLLIFCLGISVWFLRNYLSTGQISNPTLTINGLHHGMYPGFMYNNLPESFAYPYKFDPQSAWISVSVSNALTAIYNNFINYPAEYLSWYLAKPLFFLQWSNIQGSEEVFIYPAAASPYYLDSGIFPVSNMVMKHIHPVVIGLSLAGILIGLLPEQRSGLSHAQQTATFFLAGIYLYFILLHIIVAPFPRYSIPIRPIIYILAYLPIYVVLRKAKQYWL